jgi:hypothetical protein
MERGWEKVIPRPLADYHGVGQRVTTVPSTRIHGEHLSIWGGGNDGDTDYWLGLSNRNLFSFFSVNDCVALALTRAHPLWVFRKMFSWNLHLGPPFSSFFSWPPWGRAADTPLILSKRDVPALGRYPSRAGEGRIPIPTVPSTRLKRGTLICMGGAMVVI